MDVDWSWWPILHVPFPFMPEGAVLDFTPVDEFLRSVGAIVGPMLVFVMVFVLVRKLLVSFSGGD